jgi:hypothetical protein
LARFYQECEGNMARGLGDSRSDIGERGDRGAHRPAGRDPVDEGRPIWPQAGVDFAREAVRERVQVRDRDYMLHAWEARTLATVGAFRVVTSDDLLSAGGDGPGRPDTDRLEALGLLRHETIADARGTTQVVTLTDQGKTLLDDHRDPNARGDAQTYYAGVVKPRELRHDAQVYRLFRAEVGRIEAEEGGRVVRVVLDYELKRDYQQYLNRPDRPADATFEQDRQAFAEAHDLTVVRDHLELPDLRIEYETAAGRLEHRDVELVTEHYSRGQLASKTQAGFVMYRSGGGGSRGGSPVDPRHLERLA